MKKIPEKLVPLTVALKAKMLQSFRQLDQRRFKEATTPPALIPEVSNAQPCFGIGVEQPLVALMHAWWYVLCLANLIAREYASIEYFKDKKSKSIRVNRGHWMAFNGVPP